MKEALVLCVLLLSSAIAGMVHASPPVRPYTGGPTQSEINAQLLKEKEALPPYPVRSPQELWQEGESLFAIKQYGEGVVLMRAALKGAPDASRRDRLAKFEADLTRQKKAAQELRNQGKDWQERGNMSKAAAAYQAGLRVWPDILLELHVKNLNSPESVKSNAEVVEMVPCDILDVSAVAPPDDFSLAYMPGTDNSDRRTVTREEIFSDGRLVRYSRSRLSLRQAGPPTYATAPQRIPEMAVRRLYAATQACAFNELKPSYRKSQDSNKWGTPWTLGLKADGKEREVRVLRAYVSRFEYLVALFNKTIGGH
jgi:hypothetical protein